MKKLRILLSLFLLCVGANVIAQYGHFYNPITQNGISYKLYTNDSQTFFYAWITSIESDATEITIPDYVYNNVISTDVFQVVGFDRDFTCNCPNMTTIRMPKNQVEPTGVPVNSNFPDMMVGYVQGDFTGMPLLSDFYFNEKAWNLKFVESGSFNGGYVSIATFASDISVHAKEERNGWRINTHVKKYYYIPNSTIDSFGYYWGGGNYLRMVSIETDGRNLVIPYIITRNGQNYEVSHIGYGSYDVYFSPETKSNVETIEVKGNPYISNVSLTEFSKLTEITFNGNIKFFDCDFGAPQLQTVEFYGSVESIGSTFDKAQALRTLYFYGEAPDLSDASFSSCSQLTIYVNLTSEEIRDLQTSGSWSSGLDVRPLNATPPGGVISGSVSDWIKQLTSSQTLDLRYLRPVGKQDSYDWQALKTLCDGTLASVQTLDLSDITLAEGLQPSFADFSTLDTLYLPRVPVTLPDGCFNGCKPNLVVIASSPTPYATASENSFGSSVQGMTLIAPSGSLYTYRTAEPWSQFGTIKPTAWAGNANISMWVGASNDPVELWADGEKIGTLPKQGGTTTQTIQMPKTVELRIPVTYLDKILINSNDVTALLPSTEPTGEAYSGYRFYTVEDISSFTAIEVKFTDENTFRTTSLMFAIDGGPGTANVAITYADGTSESFDMEHDGESSSTRTLNFYDTTPRGTMYATTKGIEQIVVRAHPETDEFALTLFDAGRINQAQAENGVGLNYTVENDGSGTYTYTLLGENMTASYVHLTFPGTMQNDIKTTIAVNGNYQVKYFFYDFDMEYGYFNAKVSDTYINGTTTVSHNGTSHSYGLILIYAENQGQNPNFRAILNGDVVECGESIIDLLLWRESSDYDSYINEVLGDYDHQPVPCYVLELSDAYTASDSWIIIDDGTTPIDQIVSPVQVTQTIQTIRVVGDGTLSLRNSEGTEVASVSEDAPSSVSWPKGDDLTLAVTLPDGADIANYEAFLFIDGTSNALQKVDGTSFAPYSMGSVNTAHDIILVIRQTGSFGTPDIIEFADAEVKRICVANWDTNGDGELSKSEAAAVTTLKVDGNSVFRGNTTIISFDELQYFTELTDLPDNAFLDCRNLKSVILPSNLRDIGNNAFYRCTSLTSLNLPESVQRIYSYVFYKAPLKTLYIPKNVWKISDNALGDCSTLVSITVDPDNQTFDSRDGSNAIYHTTNNNLIGGCINTVIPEGVVSLGQAFYEHVNLKSIEIPSTVTSIANSCFYGCSQLASVVSKRQQPVSIGEFTFKNISANCVLTVPYGTRDAYIAAGWTTDIFKGGIVEDNSQYDTNGDGSVNITDVTKLVNVILGK